MPQRQNAAQPGTSLLGIGAKAWLNCSFPASEITKASCSGSPRPDATRALALRATVPPPAPAATSRTEERTPRYPLRLLWSPDVSYNASLEVAAGAHLRQDQGDVCANGG